VGILGSHAKRSAIGAFTPRQVRNMDLESGSNRGKLSIRIIRGSAPRQMRDKSEILGEKGTGTTRW